MNDSLETRVAALERSSRRWQAAGLTLAVLLVAAAFRPGPPPASLQEAPELLRARSFELVDGEGRVRARLALRVGQPGLELFDENGLPRVTLAHDNEESALYLRDEEGTVRVGVAQFAHGGGGVALHGPQAQGAAVLYYRGEGSLTFYDEGGGIVERLPGGQLGSSGGPSEEPPGGPPGR